MRIRRGWAAASGPAIQPAVTEMRATRAIETANSSAVEEVGPTANTSAIASVGTTPARAPRQRARRPAWGGFVSVAMYMLVALSMLQESRPAQSNCHTPQETV